MLTIPAVHHLGFLELPEDVGDQLVERFIDGVDEYLAVEALGAGAELERGEAEDIFDVGTVDVGDGGCAIVSGDDLAALAVPLKETTIEDEDVHRWRR